MECLSCASNSGEKRISPGPTIYEGRWWLVEHAYPVKRTGWTVIVLKRHAEALHELTPQEFAELAEILYQLTRFLYAELQCEKEYVSCYAEADGFQHIHFHVFARPANFPPELKGGKSFALLKVATDEAIPPEDIAAFCESLKQRFDHWVAHNDVG